MSSQHSNQTNIWQGRSVLVTGCTGLLGSAMTRSLVDLGANVVGLIRDTVPRSGLFTEGTSEQIIAVKGDVREQFLIERMVPGTMRFQFKSPPPNKLPQRVTPTGKL